MTRLTYTFFGLVLGWTIGTILAPDEITVFIERLGYGMAFGMLAMMGGIILDAIVWPSPTKRDHKDKPNPWLDPDSYEHKLAMRSRDREMILMILWHMMDGPRSDWPARQRARATAFYEGHRFVRAGGLTAQELVLSDRGSEALQHLQAEYNDSLAVPTSVVARGQESDPHMKGFVTEGHMRDVLNKVKERR